jgi:hypothetical protein
VGATGKLVHFFDGDAVDFVVDVEAADVLTVAYFGKRKVSGGRKRGAAGDVECAPSMTSMSWSTLASSRNRTSALWMRYLDQMLHYYTEGTHVPGAQDKQIRRMRH